MGFFKSLKNIAEKINDVASSRDVNIVKAIDCVRPNTDKTHLPPHEETYNFPNKINEEIALSKAIHGVRDMKILFNGEKFAVYQTDDKLTSDFIYDDAYSLSRNHIALSVIQPDGSIRYAVAVPQNDLYITPAEFVAVDFFDGDDGVLVIDEDGDRYIVEYDGSITRQAVYIKELHESLKDNDNNNDDNDNDDYDDCDD